MYKYKPYNLPTPKFDAFSSEQAIGSTLGSGSGNLKQERGAYQSANFKPDGKVGWRLTPDRASFTDVTIASRIIGVSDSTQLTQAITDLADGGIIRLADGTYTITSSLSIPSNVLLEGVTQTGVILSLSGSTQIQIVGTNNYSAGTVSISSGGTALTGSSTSWLANVVAGYRVRLNGLWYPIAAVGSDTSITLAVPYGGESLSGASYLSANTKNYCGIRNLTIQSSSAAGLKIQYATFFDIEDVTIAGCASGIDLDDAGQGSFYQVTLVAHSGEGANFSNINLTTVQAVFALSNGSNGITQTGANSTENVYRDIACIDNTGIGLNLTGGTDCVVGPAAIRSNGSYGVYADTITDLVISPSRIKDNTSDGMRLNTNVVDAKIAVGRIKDNGGYGINIVASSCTNTNITSCVFSGNSSGAVNDSGTTTLIRGNVGVDDNSTSATQVNTITDTFTAGEPIASGSAVFIEDSGTDISKLDVNVSSSTDLTIGRGSGSNTAAAQSFALTGGVRLSKLKIFLKKVGTPSDNVVLALKVDNSSAPASADLTTVTLDGSTLTTSYVEYTFTVGYDLTSDLSSGTTYWFAVRRSGSLDSANYYQLQADTASVYSTGSYSVTDAADQNSSWTGGGGPDVGFEIITSTTTGRVYNASARNTAESNAQIGFATAAQTASGSSVTVAVGGKITVLSGLTQGTQYFLADAFGKIATSAGTVSKKVGVAGKNTTDLYIMIQI